MATVTISGPFFDGRNPLIRRDLEDEGLNRVGGQGLADVHANLNTSIRNPTPYYETQITSERQGDTQVVHDRGVIYGPWLEGTGSRNQTTRFKGYASFRRAAQELEGQAGGILVPIVDRAVGRLNG
ncbi:hypothetical protein ACIBCH_20585 [Amycolatopsis thailandensis]|uniref:hypothetical protein n=1 Tax=Amycolatopsis thailandensis TaxID=589330 RepID=UPI0037B0D04E